MTKKPFFVHSNISILDCLKAMVNTHYRRLPLVTDKKVTGIVTSMDILKYIHDNGKIIRNLQEDYNLAMLAKPLKDIVIDDVLCVEKGHDVSDAIKTMKKKNIGGLPVTDEKGILDGFITERDILEIIT
jgi:CBS domain-containing protein